MFKINIPITKAESKDGKLVVRGTASGPAIDKDFERFDSSALNKMTEVVNGGGIPIRLEHEDKVYTTIGEWTMAGLDDDFVMSVEGAIDTELSLGKDIGVLLKRGEEICLSVGGRVVDAGFEYNKELGKNIKVYKDVTLDEISVVKNPAYQDASLTLGKSVNWESIEEGEKFSISQDAEQLDKTHKSMKKVEVEEFTSVCGKPKKRKKRKFTTKAKSWEHVVDLYADFIVKAYSDMSTELVMKDYEDEYYSQGISTTDMQIIVQVAKFLSEVEVPETMARPAQLDDWDYLEKLPEEAYIIMGDRRMILPHHNVDLSVNKDHLAYALKQLFDGQHFWRPKEYSVAINHLYYHLKEFSMLKAGKTKEDKKKTDGKKPAKDDAVEDNIKEENKKKPKSKAKTKKVAMSQEEIDLMQLCADFVAGVGKKPTLKGESLADEVITKLASAYKVITDGDSSIQLIASDENSMKKKVKKNEEQAPVEEKKEEVVDEKKEDTTEETKVEDTTEEKTEEATEDKTEDATEEETKEEDTTEKSEEDATEDGKEEKKEDAKEEKEDETTTEDTEKEDSTEKSKKVDKSLNKDNFVTKAQLSEFAKSVSDLTEAVNALSKGVNNDVKSLKGDVEKTVKSVEAISKYVTSRKSMTSAQALEKTFSKDEVNEGGDLATLAQKKMDDDKMSFTDAYKASKLELAEKAQA